MNLQKYIMFGLGLMLYASCANDPGFDNIPEIAFINISKDSLIQDNLNTDSLYLIISFKDGDGDLGTDNKNVNENIIVTDRRTGVISDRFNIPKIESNGLQSSVEGEITLKIYTTCCIFPDSTPPCENPSQFPTNELSFEVQLIDDSGNSSNVINTSFITLLCN